MSNSLFRRIAIRRNIYKRILKIKSNFTFYLKIIDEFLDCEFINNKNKNYLRKTRTNLLRAKKKIESINKN